MNETTHVSTICKHCGRFITQDADGRWIDPEATGDDSVWRETCDSHDTFDAVHEPVDNPCSQCSAEVEKGDPHTGYGMCAECLHDALRSGWTPGD